MGGRKGLMNGIEVFHGFQGGHIHLTHQVLILVQNHWPHCFDSSERSPYLE